MAKEIVVMRPKALVTRETMERLERLLDSGARMSRRGRYRCLPLSELPFSAPAPVL